MRWADDLALRYPARVKFRLASLLMDPRRHPYPEDNRWYLARKGISGCWRSSEFALRKKIFYSAWFMLVIGVSYSGFNIVYHPRSRAGEEAQIHEGGNRGD